MENLEQTNTNPTETQEPVGSSGTSVEESPVDDIERVS